MATKNVFCYIIELNNAMWFKIKLKDAQLRYFKK